MSTRQIYESTIFSDYPGLEAGVMVIPKSAYDAFPKGVDYLDYRVFFERLDAEVVIEKMDERTAIRNLAASLYCEDFDHFRFIIESEEIPEEVTFFAHELYLTPVIPFENSPLSNESIGTIVKTGSVVSIGSTIGFLVVGTSPLLFVAVPAGIIIVGAAAGIGRGLEEGLRDKIKNMINGVHDQTEA